MRRSIAIASLCFAWLCANGAIWDVAQVFAWARMFTGYAETASVGEALRETFDASKPCKLCCAIAKAKNSEQKPASRAIERDTGKLILAVDTPAQIFLTAPATEWSAVRCTMTDPRVEPVPVPPPRA